jgi:predicted NUDIX family NTP pyrophosphohydrolase
MKSSAGILLYKLTPHLLVFLVHPGGPFWKNKDHGAWSIPKGEMEEGEEPFDRARIEFHEETGQEIDGNFIELGSIRQKSGKMVWAWAVEGDIDPDTILSNTIPIEWPPRSGKMIDIPEVDRGEWFAVPEAKEKINPAQAALIGRLEEILTA